MVLDLLELAELKAEMEARRTPSSTSSGDQGPVGFSGGELVGEAASASGYLGALVVPAAGHFACVHVAASTYPILLDALELDAPSLAAGSTAVIGLYRRTILDQSMQGALIFPTGGVPTSAQGFADELAAVPAPDGGMVIGNGMFRRDGLQWVIPQGSGFSLVGPVGLTLAFGVSFHELVR